LIPTSKPKAITTTSFWLVPGFAAEWCSTSSLDLDTFAWAGEVGNRLIGGLLLALVHVVLFLQVVESAYWAVVMLCPTATA